MGAVTNFTNGLLQDDVETLHWTQFSDMSTVPTAFRYTGKFRAYEIAKNSVVMNLTAYVLGKKDVPHTETRRETVTFQTPETWLDHLLIDHGRRWFLRPLTRRRPPKMRSEQRTVQLTTTWEHMTVFPWADVCVPEAQMGQPYHIRTLSSSVVNVTQEQQ